MLRFATTVCLSSLKKFKKNSSEALRTADKRLTELNESQCYQQDIVSLFHSVAKAFSCFPRRLLKGSLSWWQSKADSLK